MAAVFDSLNDKDLINLINNGRVGVLPTDTIYGLVCRADNEQAVERLYKLKERQHKPGTVIAASIDQLVDLGFKRRYLKAVEQFWPGAVSVVIPSLDASTNYLRMGLPDIAIRVSNDKKLQNLLSKTGALLTSSANLANKDPANTVEEAKQYFDDNVDFYVNGGNLADREPSTIIKIIDDEIEVLRPGAVKIDVDKGVIN